MRLPHPVPHREYVRETTEQAAAAIVEVVHPDPVWTITEVREPGIGIPDDHDLNSRLPSEAVTDVATAGPTASHGVEQTVVGGVAVKPAQALKQTERPARDRWIEDGGPRNRCNADGRVLIPSADNFGDHSPAFAVSDEVDRPAVGAERRKVSAERVGSVVGSGALGCFDRIIRRPGPPIVEDANVGAIHADALCQVVKPLRVAPVAGNVDKQGILWTRGEPRAPSSSKDGARDHRTAETGATRRGKGNPYRSASWLAGVTRRQPERVPGSPDVGGAFGQ